MHCQTRGLGKLKNSPCSQWNHVYNREKREDVRRGEEERRREEELCAQGLPFLGAVRLTHHQSPSGINKYSRTNYRQALLQRIKPTWNTACRAGHTNNNIEQQMRTTRVHHRLATFTPSWLAPVQHYKHAWIRNAGLIILWQACLLYGTLSGLLAQRGQDVADFLESEG